MVILDMDLDCLAYSQIGPAEKIVRNKNGDKMYIIITYKRSGRFFELKVPKFYSAYYERPYIYIRHSYGEYYFIFRSIIDDFNLFNKFQIYFLDRYYLTGYNSYRIRAQTVNICRECSLACVCTQRHFCRITTCQHRPKNWFLCPRRWADST